MTAVTPGNNTTGPSRAPATRAGRALIGWLPAAQAQLMLAGNLKEQATLATHVQRAAAARSQVAARPPRGATPAPVAEPGPDLGAHIGRLHGHADFRPFAAEGWRVVIADLAQVCALQPMVLWEPADGRAQGAAADDMPSLAALTLPLRDGPENVPLQFDPALNVWIVSSPNPNLRILGHFSAPVPAGDGQTYLGCGFFVATTPSLMQVVRYRGRHLLRDGYHRALALLARGISRVPVLYRELDDLDALDRGPGLLPEAAYLGERPPMLPDYLSDTVACEVRAPASQRMVMVQGLELNPFI